MFFKCALCCLSQALMDILQQDRREAAEQRQELCDIITRLRGELQSTEEHWEKVNSCHKLALWLYFLNSNQLLKSVIYSQSLVCVWIKVVMVMCL